MPESYWANRLIREAYLARTNTPLNWYNYRYNGGPRPRFDPGTLFSSPSGSSLIPHPDLYRGIENGIGGGSLETPFSIGAPRNFRQFQFRPTSGPAGFGFGKLQINQIPSSGSVFNLGGDVPFGGRFFANHPNFRASQLQKSFGNFYSSASRFAGNSLPVVGNLIGAASIFSGQSDYYGNDPTAARGVGYFGSLVPSFLSGFSSSGQPYRTFSSSPLVSQLATPNGPVDYSPFYSIKEKVGRETIKRFQYGPVNGFPNNGIYPLQNGNVFGSNGLLGGARSSFGSALRGTALAGLALGQTFYDYNLATNGQTLGIQAQGRTSLFSDAAGLAALRATAPLAKNFGIPGLLGSLAISGAAAFGVGQLGNAFTSPLERLSLASQKHLEESGSSFNKALESLGARNLAPDIGNGIYRAFGAIGQGTSTTGDFVLGANSPLLIAARSLDVTGSVDKYAIRESQNALHNQIRNQIGAANGKSREEALGLGYAQFVRNLDTKNFNADEDINRLAVSQNLARSSIYSYGKEAGWNNARIKQEYAKFDYARQEVIGNQLLGAAESKYKKELGSIFSQQALKIRESYQPPLPLITEKQNNPINAFAKNYYNTVAGFVNSAASFISGGRSASERAARTQADFTEQVRLGKPNPVDNFLGSLGLGSLVGRPNIYTPGGAFGLNGPNRLNIPNRIYDVQRNLKSIQTARQLARRPSPAQAEAASGASSGSNRGPSPYQRFMIQRYLQQDQRNLSIAKNSYNAARVRGIVDANLERPVFDNPRVDYHEANAQVNFIPGVTSFNELTNQLKSAYDNQLNRIQGEAAGNEKEYQQFLKNADEAKLFARKELEGGTHSKDPIVALRALTDYEREIASITKTVNQASIAHKRYNESVQKTIAGESPYISSGQGAALKQVQYAAVGDTRFNQSYGRQLTRQSLLEQQYELGFERQLGLVSKPQAIKEDFRLRRETAKSQGEDTDALIQDRKERLLKFKTLDTSAYTDEQRKGLQDVIGGLEKSVSYLQERKKKAEQDAENAYGPSKENLLIRQVYGQTIAKQVTPYITSLSNAALTGQNPVSSLQGNFYSQFNGIFAQSIGQGAAGIASRLFGSNLGKGVGPVSIIHQLLNTKYGGTTSVPVGPTPPSFFTRPQINQAITGLGLGLYGSQTAYPYLNPYYNRAAGTVGSVGLGAAGALAGQALNQKYGSFIGSTAGSLLGGAAGLTGASPLGGAVSGGLFGAIGGASLGSRLGSIGGVPGSIIGAGIGAIGGSLFGWLGGRQQARKQQQQQLLNQQADEFARGQFGKGPSYAGELFDGYGSFSSDLQDLQGYIGRSRENSLVKANNLKGKAKNAFRRRFRSQAALFNPIINLANANKDILSRPGGAEGALYDIGLGEDLRVQQAGPYSGQAIGSLTNVFQSIRSNLGQYGFDTQRAQAANSLFNQTYQNLRTQLGDQLSTGDRDFGFLVRSQKLNASERSIQRDVLNRQVTNYDRDSRQQIEGVLGTLQRRENRSAIVAQLKEEQSFNKDILLRKQANFNEADSLQGSQDFAQRTDFLKNLDNQQQALVSLDQGFRDLSPKLTDASDEFYRLTELIREVNQQMETLTRNLR